MDPASNMPIGDGYGGTKGYVNSYGDDEQQSWRQYDGSDAHDDYEAYGRDGEEWYVEDEGYGPYDQQSPYYDDDDDRNYDNGYGNQYGRSADPIEEEPEAVRGSGSPAPPSHPPSAAGDAPEVAGAQNLLQGGCMGHLPLRALQAVGD